MKKVLCLCLLAAIVLPGCGWTAQQRWVAAKESYVSTASTIDLLAKAGKIDKKDVPNVMIANNTAWNALSVWYGKIVVYGNNPISYQEETRDIIASFNSAMAELVAAKVKAEGAK